MPKKVIIFDFDGTIADTFDSILKIINRLSDEFGYKKVKEDDVDKLRDKKSQEILKNSGISMIELPFFIKRVKSELNKEIESLKPTKGIKDALLKLKKDGYKLVILTSNSKENVSKFLKKNNLDLFDFIYSGSSIFGKSKVINSLLKKLSLRPEEVIYVGDETRDIEAAKKTNIKIIAVSWGFNSKQILKKQKPDFLISKPKELIKIIEG